APSSSSGKDLEGDASGLIDIRTLASGARADRDGVDDLISIGGGGFAPSLGAPVLAAQRTGLSLGAKIGLVGGAFAVLAAAVVIVVVLLNKEEPPKQDPQMAILLKQIENLKKSGGGETQQMANLQKQLNQKQTGAGDGTQAGAAAGGGADTAGADDKKGGKGAAAKVGGGGGGSAGKPRGDKEPGDRKPGKGDDLLGGGGGADKPVAEKPASGKKNDELDDLLGGSLGGPAPKKEKPAEKPVEKPVSKSAGGGGGGGGGGDLPDTLNRGDVQTGMNAVAGQVSKCGQGQTGSVTVKVVIGNAGRVQDAQTVGALAGTPVGQCAARAVRTARFPKFKNPQLIVTYPFKL
ncbi:MAG: hypothetical protein PHU25_14110, partial [Deltaproteobacteria bacterium]|nr:hypothetical protein [Deltaproteobacteria bacterium]